MSDINFLDKNLEHLFQAKDSFLVAKSFKGEIYRKYEVGEHLFVLAIRG